MTQRRSFEAHEITAILALYQCGAYIQHRALTGGSVQTNVLVETTAGLFVLRSYERRAIDAVRFEVELLRHLTQHGYPCPAPIAQTDGTWIGVYNARPFVLFEFVTGQHVEHLNARQQHALIRSIAELHRITHGYRPAHTADRWNYDATLCRQLATQAAESIGTDEARVKLAWLIDQLDRLELPASLPRGVCHGDLNLSNVLFQGDTFRALLDFDDANYTFLLFDVIGLISLWAWPYDRATLAIDEARAVLAIYTRYRPLTADEQRHLFDVFKLSILIDCVWYFARGSFPEFYEKLKIDHLDAIGRDRLRALLFSDIG